MSISSAMSNAVLGLRAAGRGAEVVSSNISNALTPGYGRRILALTSGSAGGLGGVRIAGVVRSVDAGIASDRRLAEAANASSQGAMGFLSRLESLLGTPDNPASLSANLSRFEGALVAAASRPDAPDRLNTAVAEARGLADSLRAASAGVQEARIQADRTIAAQVQELNIGLHQIQTLNVQISSTQSQGGETSGLLDQRQQVVDRIGKIVPLREIARDNGQIALYSTGGAALIDGQAVTIGFEPANLVTPYMSIEGGTLSGLTINDRPIRTDSETGALRGGSLGSQFAVRDELSVTAQSDIDAIARDLVDRFADPTIDPTLGVGDVGLFTDEGAALNPTEEIGLASRLSLNAAVDPAQGGEAWRMRDGINAAAEGNVGNATLMQSLTDALTTSRDAASGSFSGAPLSATGMISAVISGVGSNLNAAEQKASFTSTRLSELTQLQMAGGVDTDQELQTLMQVEQAYAANARMIEVLDELMQILNRL
ncbi:MAG: flagellar hook-associated protein FlgK [Sulfitobacter sp.]